MSLINETRRFRASDGPAVIELFEQGNLRHRDEAGRASFDAYMRRARTAELVRLAQRETEVGACFWVVELNKSVVALFGLEPAGDDTLELRRLYVAQRLSGRGLGAEVLRQAETTAWRMGAKYLKLETSAYQHRAIRLYERAGYALRTEDRACDPLRGISDGAPRWVGQKTLQPTHVSICDFITGPFHV